MTRTVVSRAGAGAGLHPSNLCLNLRISGLYFRMAFVKISRASGRDSLTLSFNNVFSVSPIDTRYENKEEFSNIHLLTESVPWTKAVFSMFGAEMT